MKLNEMLHVKREPISLSDDDKKRLVTHKKNITRNFLMDLSLWVTLTSFLLLITKRIKKCIGTNSRDTLQILLTYFPSIVIVIILS